MVGLSQCVDMKTVLKELQGFARLPLETPTTDVDD